MSDLVAPLKTAFAQFGWRDVCDVIIMAVFIYAILKILAKTRAMRVVIGLGIILLIAWVASLLNLATVEWAFSWFGQALAIFLVVLFQPELRRALETLGRGKIFGNLRTPEASAEELVTQFMTAITDMAKNRVGAILVFERLTGLADLVETGTVVDADVSAALIETIFYPNNPLHDGAMIIRDGRIWAAGCFLPLSDNKQIAAELGTRHRASLGVSEVSDAYVLVVSEERGEVSFVYDGVITTGISYKRLRRILEQLYVPEEKPSGFAAIKKAFGASDKAGSASSKKEKAAPAEESGTKASLESGQEREGENGSTQPQEGASAEHKEGENTEEHHG